MGLIGAILSYAAERTRFVVSMSNKYMSVPGTAGIMSLACGGVVVYELCQKKIDWHVVRGCGFGAVAFGAVWWWKSKDGEQSTTNDVKSAKEDNTKVDTPSSTIEPTVQQASEIGRVSGEFDDHQRAGKFLYQDDICLFYGEEHIAKTSIALNIVMDLVLQRVSFLMPNDDEGDHIPHHCLWYNGEMTEADFQKFFGNFDRSLLDGKIDFISNFELMTIEEWLENVKGKLLNCRKDTVVVLDNLSCISSSTSSDVRNIKNAFRSVQDAVKEHGIHVLFIIIDHINKKGDVAGSYKLKALFSNRIRLEGYGKEHTRLTVEKNRAYHDMVAKSYDLAWRIAPEGNQSFENVGEIPKENSAGVATDTSPILGCANKGGRFPSITEEQIIEMDRLEREEHWTHEQIGTKFGVTRETVCKKLNKWRKEQATEQ